jgi:signal transduction histidine kinase
VAFAAAALPPAPRSAYLSLIVAFVLVVAAGHRRAAAVMIVAGYVGTLWVIPLARGDAGPPLDRALLLGGWLAVLAVAGEVVRVRREQVAVTRAARQAEEGRRRSDERLRMARDLHDIIGHNIALISVQAGTGLDLFDHDPEQARQSLAAIRTVAKEALEELRSLLAALRYEGDEAPHAPAPGVDRLPDLVATSRAAGLPVTLRVDGAPTVLPATVDLAAYRIVQESLTNIVRHAGPAATATIRLTYETGRLRIRVHDDGRAVAAHRPHATGSGIAGMCERAAALGGRLRAGPEPAGGFTVVAELPVNADHGGRP